ncbi:hypothetical protein LTR62_000512 [Meristemomyces frigidus]|uniref:Uncharacterized protein n=1 Tax=Meristemomyces frigidus TaxID=1508187 RepID=A0AAN7TA49_9PEZI|nr:hypothetical protein LTR62_000512 [Meristemomyces frigidus]
MASNHRYQDSGYASSSNAATSVSNLSRPGATPAQSYSTVNGGVRAGRYAGTTTTQHLPVTAGPESSLEDRKPTPIMELPTARAPEPETQYQPDAQSHVRQASPSVMPSTERQQHQARPPVLKRKSDRMDWNATNPDTLGSTVPPPRPYANTNFSRPSPTREAPPPMRPRPSAEAVRRRSSHHYEGGNGSVTAFDGREALRELKQLGRESKPILRETVRSLGEVAMSLQAVGRSKMAEHEQRQLNRSNTRQSTTSIQPDIPLSIIPTHPSVRQHAARGEDEVPAPPSLPDIPPRSPQRMSRDSATYTRDKTPERRARHRTWDSLDLDDAPPAELPPPRPPFATGVESASTDQRGSISPMRRGDTPPAMMRNGRSQSPYTNHTPIQPWAQHHAPPDPMYHSSPPSEFAAPVHSLDNMTTTIGSASVPAGHNDLRISRGEGGYLAGRTQGLEHAAAEAQVGQTEPVSKRSRMMNKLRKRRAVA